MAAAPRVMVLASWPHSLLLQLPAPQIYSQRGSQGTLWKWKLNSVTRLTTLQRPPQPPLPSPLLPFSLLPSPLLFSLTAATLPLALPDTPLRVSALVAFLSPAICLTYPSLQAGPCSNVTFAGKPP